MTKSAPPAARRSGVADAVRIAARSDRSGQTHGAAAAAIRALVEQRRKAAATEFARGDVAARRLCETIDELVAALCEVAGADAGAAVCAVGGYGRGLLAPYSDIDLLFLVPGKDADAGAVADAVLYPLWDAGLKVGHAVHAPAEAIAQAMKDPTAETAFLDARLVAGAPRVFKDFAVRYDAMRWRRLKAFLSRMAQSRDARHERSDQSRFLAEPNLKEGKGGLRDLQTIRWMNKYADGREIDDPKARKKRLSKEDVAALRRCERFLWSVRVQLHAMAGRPEEVLTFDLQPALAERLGYADRAGTTAAERMMKHYFLNAMEVGRLTRLFSARLEEERAGLSAARLKPLPAALLNDEAGAKANLKLQGGRLHFADGKRARRTPLDFFRLFRAFSRRPDFDFHPDALAMIAAAGALVGPDVRKDPVIARLFLASLAEAADPVKLLRVMAETGLLGKYLPSFGRIVGRIEYGLYRRYAIDEGAFRAVGVLKALERGALKDDHPIATKIVARRKDRTALFAAVLLHETSWGLDPGEGEAAAEISIARAMRRLGVAEEEAALLAWCAARHALMLRTAERRNLAEAETIVQFAREAASRERLDLLLVVAVCHLRGAAAASWSGWMKDRLTELYEGARAFLDGGEERLARWLDARAETAREEAEALLSSWPGEERRAFLSTFSTAMYCALEPVMIARIGELARAVEGDGEKAGVAARVLSGDAEFIVYAADRPGLLADLAGAIAAAGADVRTVQAMTTSAGKAIDIFLVRAPDDAAGRLHAALLAAAKSAPKSAPAPARRLGDRRTIFSVPPAVRIDRGAGADRLVVEAEGRDRPGLLRDLARAFSELGVTIASAHIATYGARAVDAFYVRDAGGGPVSDPGRLEEMRKRLLSVLGDGAPRRTALTPKT